MKRIATISFLLLATMAFAAGYDMRSTIDIDNVMPPQVVNASKTSNAVDVSGYRGATICIQQAESTNSAANNLSWNLLECDTSNGTFTPVISSQIKGSDVAANASGTIFNLTENASATQANVAYLGNKNFLKLDIVANGTVTATASVSVIKQSPYLGR